MCISLTLCVFLSHDVDWSKRGPSIEHILARRERFEQSVIESAATKNVYYNIPEIMDIERALSVRSTFFFRTKYESGTYLDYIPDIEALLNGGWEIGLHSDPSSVKNIERLREEKQALECLTGSKIIGHRVHYLKHDQELTVKLNKLGFAYDSSVKTHKDNIHQDDMDYRIVNGILQFPITIMDAYLFTYMKISEEKLLDVVSEALDIARQKNKQIVSILWHENVLKMKGGRMYKQILEHLVARPEVKVVRGADLLELIPRISTKEN